MANITDVQGNIRASLASSLAAGATSLDADTEFTGKIVHVPGYLTVGDPTHLQNGDAEFIRYEGFTRNGDGTSTFSGLTRGVGNSTDQAWDSGVNIGASITGEQLKRLPEQEEDFSLGGNSITTLLSLIGSAQSSEPSSPSAGEMYFDDGNNTLNGAEGWRTYIAGSWVDNVYTATYGIEWDQGDDTWRQIDSYGETITPSDSDFASHPLWGGIERVNMASDGTINARWGDAGYEDAPTNKDVNVMVEIPKFYYKYEYIDGKFRFWASPFPEPGFTLHPAFNQGSVSDYAYISAYEASAYSDDGGTTWYLASRSGETPVHGNGDYTGLNGNTLSNLGIEEARAYAQNVGAGWQQYEIWGYAAHRFLSMVYLGSMDFQSDIGRGIVDKTAGTGFNGEVTGFDNIDAQLSQANLGTATGTGTDGFTPISILWVENPYGNIWTFVDGYEATDGEYRIMARDGSWSVVGPPSWGTGDYEVSTATPLTDDDGYIDDVEAEELLGLIGIPAATAGSSSTYIPDYFYSHDSGQNNILRSGAAWLNGDRAGLASLNSDLDVTNSYRVLGARLAYLG